MEDGPGRTFGGIPSLRTGRSNGASWYRPFRADGVGSPRNQGFALGLGLGCPCGANEGEGNGALTSSATGGCCPSSGWPACQGTANSRHKDPGSGQFLPGGKKLVSLPSAGGPEVWISKKVSCATTERHVHHLNTPMPKPPAKPAAKSTAKPQLKDLKARKDVRGGSGPQSSPMSSPSPSPSGAS
jgi:hypothetical protein